MTRLLMIFILVIAAATVSIYFKDGKSMDGKLIEAAEASYYRYGKPMDGKLATMGMESQLKQRKLDTMGTGSKLMANPVAMHKRRERGEEALY